MPIEPARLTGKVDWLELSVVQYQYPTITVEPYDSNWLIIHARSGCASGTWEASDACLLTYELRYLTDWLETFGDTASDDWLEFLEPALAFRAVEGALEARLDYEFAPPWAQASREPQILSFARDSATVSAAATALRAHMLAFPQRPAR